MSYHNAVLNFIISQHQYLLLQNDLKLIENKNEKILWYFNDHEASLEKK